MSVYFVASDDMQRVKIGKTRAGRPAYERWCDLIRSSPYPLLLVGEIEGEINVEGALHARFADTRIQGEWFVTSPALENVIREVQIIGRVWSAVHYPLHLQADIAPNNGRYSAREKLYRMGFRVSRRGLAARTGRIGFGEQAGYVPGEKENAK